MAKRRFRYDEGGDVEEAANASEESQDIAKSMGAGPKNEEEPAKKQSFKEAFAEARKGGDKSFEWNGKKYSTAMAGPAPVKEKAPEPKKLVQETMRDRAESYVAKRAAQRAEDAAKDTTPRGQDRILTGIKKNAGQNKLMGSLGLKSGGSVSSASRRADGIATKGKTRGKMC